MKTKYFVLAAMSLSAFAFAQKRELRDVEKLIKSGSYAEAKTQLTALDGMMGEMKDDQKMDYYRFKAQAYLGEEKDFSGVDTALEALGMAGKMKSAEDNPELAQLRAQAINKSINSAVEDQNNKKFTQAAGKLEKLYRMSPKDTIYLYYAASNLINDQKYTEALDYYLELRDMGYNGAEVKYTAVNKENGEKETFGDKTQRDLMVDKAKTHIKPEMETTESKRPEIAEKIALIYMQNGEDQKALDAMAEARNQNPEDVELMKNEAELFRKLEMNDKYEMAMEKIIAQDPNNPNLLVNLGITSGQAGNIEKAREYYNKALAIDPENSIANLNIAVAILDKDKELVDKMNSLGTSSADNKKYEAYKEERMGIYGEAIPYLEKAVAGDPENKEVVRTLFNIHSQVGNTEKAAKYKAMLDGLEGK